MFFLLAKLPLQRTSGCTQRAVEKVDFSRFILLFKRSVQHLEHSGKKGGPREASAQVQSCWVGVEFTAKDGKIWSDMVSSLQTHFVYSNHLNQSHNHISIICRLVKEAKKVPGLLQWRVPCKTIRFSSMSATAKQPPRSITPIANNSHNKNNNRHQQQSWATKNNRQQQQWLKVSNHSNPRTVYNSTTVQHYNITTVQRYNTTTL